MNNIDDKLLQTQQQPQQQQPVLVSMVTWLIDWLSLHVQMKCNLTAFSEVPDPNPNQ